MRPYQTGDDLRMVDWSVYRRLGKLYVRRYQAEQSRVITVLLDTSASMAHPAQRFRGAQLLAGAIAVVSARQLDRVAVVHFSEDLGETRARTQRGGLPTELLAYISNLRCAGRTAIASAMGSAALSAPRGSTVVVVTDCYDGDGLRDGVSALAARGCETVIVHLAGAADREPPLRGGALLEDAELRETREVYLDERRRRAYRTAFADWIAELRGEVALAGGRYLTVDYAAPVDGTIRRLVGEGR